MPFDFKAYDAKCAGLTPLELQKEWEHYTRLIAGGATSTAVSGLAIPLTAGISTIGVALAAPGLHNSRRKREIIERHLQRHGTTHETRKRDVLGSMAFSGTVGVVTLGVGSMGADSIVQNGAEHGLVLCDTAVKAVTHVALDGCGMALEHAHTSQQRKKDAHIAFGKAGVFQAVANAKAQEAGYSTDPDHQQNPQQMQAQYYSAGPSSAAGSSTMPPPMYAPYDPLQPAPAPPGYAAASVGVHSRVATEKQPERAPQQVYDPYQQYYQPDASVASHFSVVPESGYTHVFAHQRSSEPVSESTATQAQLTGHPSFDAVTSTVYTQKQQAGFTQAVSETVVAGAYELQDHDREPDQPSLTQNQPASLPSPPVQVFEMSALEQALPQHYTASATQHYEHGPASPQPLTPSATDTTVKTASTPQTMYSQMTRSSTMAYTYNTAYQVQPGYCPTQQPQQTYQPPPPPPPALSQQTSGLQQQAMLNSASQEDLSHNIMPSQPNARHSYLHHQQYPQTTTVDAAPAIRAPSQTHYQQLPMSAAYDPATSTSSYSYVPSPMSTPRMTPQTPQRPASMYFAPPPEQTAATGAKSKRMSMMSMATNRLASGLSSAADALENYAQKQSAPPEAQFTAAHNTAGVAVQARPQPTPQQCHNMHAPAQEQTIGSLPQQQQQQYGPYKPMATGPVALQQFPPTPLSLPTSPEQTQSGQQYQPQYAQQTLPQSTGYFPAPSPLPPAQQYQVPHYTQQAPSNNMSGLHDGYAYQQPGSGVAVGYGAVLTPMATPHIV